MSAVPPVDSSTDDLIDGSFELHIEDDRMSATLFVEPPRGGQAVTEAQVRAALAGRGVVAGILDDALRQAVERHDGLSTRIAAGRKPVAGKSAFFTSLIESPRQHHDEDDENDENDGQDDGTYARIDYRNMGSLILVKPGAPLMRRTPAVPGTPGFDITGKVLDPAKIEDPPFALPLPGAKPSAEDPDLLVAEIAGAPKVMPRGVSVASLVEIEAVDLNSGNIDFDGTLRVKGDILAGMMVRVTGDVFVSGTIEAAEVHAGGNITVNGGIIGMTETVSTDGQEQSRAARLVSGGMVKARFILHAEIEAAQMVAAEREIRQCFVDSGDSVVVGPPGGQNGIIVGGRVRAMTSVQSGVIGSTGAVQTDIEVGLDPRAHAHLTALQQKRQGLAEQQAKLEKVVMFLHANPQKDVDGIGDRARKTYKQTFTDLEALKAEEAELIAALQPKPDAYVAARKTIHSGVRIRVGHKQREFREDYPGGKVGIGQDGEIAMS
ncbi:DUF342 domain-containing protein [Bordetella sp. FB-8]|uniref:DUF342 domain-containing protein n=1 Tax=Bordetella sp. FB-8 TaxID=1159870 RepID=UPI0003737035|nr:FapA family protein [Bordetella sp. FB-8]